MAKSERLGQQVPRVPRASKVPRVLQVHQGILARVDPREIKEILGRRVRMVGLATQDPSVQKETRVLWENKEH